jgi:hypothetical protein
LAIQRQHLEERLVLQCKDSETGRLGQLIVEDENLSLALWAIDDPHGGIWPDAERRLVLLETGEYATLLDCVAPSLSQLFGPAFRVQKQHTIPNIVLIGSRAWETQERARWLSFTFTGANSALFYREHVESRFEMQDNEFLQTEITDHARTNIFNVRTDEGTTITARLDWNSNPYLVVETDTALDIDEILALANTILLFFQISLGHRSKMFDMMIGGLPEAQQRDGDAASECFKLRRYFTWVPREVTHKGDIIFPVYTASERRGTETSLKTWVERRVEWGTTYLLARRYLAGSEVYDRDRLLRLMAWFEAIPSYNNETGITDKDLQNLRRKIREQREFTQIIRGLQSPWAITADPADHAKRRLSAALNQLRRYELKERLSQAVGRVRTCFGQQIVPSWCEVDCGEAARMRDDAAHGSRGKPTDDFPLLERAIHAVEMVCLLSMVADLGVPTDRLCKGHPLQTYRRMGRPRNEGGM